MIDRIASILAVRLNAYTGNENIAIDFVRYTISIFISVLFIYSISLMIGYFTSTFYETLASLLVLGIFRALTGGFHLNLDTCTVVTIILITMIVHVNIGHIQLLNLISMITVILFGNNGKRKIVSAIMIAANTIFPVQFIANCFFVQSLTLFPYLKGGETSR